MYSICSRSSGETLVLRISVLGSFFIELLLLFCFCRGFGLSPMPLPACRGTKAKLAINAGCIKMRSAYRMTEPSVTQGTQGSQDLALPFSASLTALASLNGGTNLTSRTRSPLLRWLRKYTPCSSSAYLHLFICCFNAFADICSPEKEQYLSVNSVLLPMKEVIL